MPRQHAEKPGNPLEELSALLKSDMDAVNAIIVARMDSPVALIPQLAGYLIAAGGKRLRPLLTLASAHIYGADMGRAQALAAAVEFIHTATLLHDDVVDESARRRGRDTANTVFGNQASVLVGDFLFSRAFQLMVADGSLDILRILSDASAVIAQGEVMQLAATGSLQTGMDTYLDVIRAKTASLFAAACEVGPVAAGADTHAARAMAEYGLNLGIAFQIADDVLDYEAAQAQIGKTPGDDFREGKMTAPVILALEKADAAEKAFWTRAMEDKEQEEGDLARAQEILKRHGAAARALEMAAAYAQKARLALSEAPDHKLRALLDRLAEYSLTRKS